MIEPGERNIAKLAKKIPPIEKSGANNLRHIYTHKFYVYIMKCKIEVSQ